MATLLTGAGYIGAALLRRLAEGDLGGGQVVVLENFYSTPRPDVEAALPPGTCFIEGDVAKVVNLYISNGWGMPVARGPRFHGTLVNVDLRNRLDVGHIFIDKSSALHQQVLGYVMQAVSHTGPQPAPTRAPAAAPAQHVTAPVPSGSPQEVTRVTAAPKPAAEDKSSAPVAEEAK